MFLLNHKFVFFLAFSILIFLPFPAPAAPKDSSGNRALSVEYRLVGVTLEALSGSLVKDTVGGTLRGIQAADWHCREAHGENARAADTADWRRTPAQATRIVPPLMFVRILPGTVIVAPTPPPEELNRVSIFETTANVGRRAPSLPLAYATLSCFNYTDSTQHGLVLMDDGNFFVDTLSCNDLYPIACAAPFAIP